MKKKKRYNKASLYWLLGAAVIIFIGLAVRVQSLFTNLFAYTYDVGRDLLKLHEITTAWNIPLIGQTSGLHGLFYGPWWYYSLIPAYVIGQGDPKAILGFIILSGVITIALGIYGGTILISKSFGLLFGLLLGISSTMISISSQIWNPNVIPVYIMILFGIYCILSVKSVSKLLLYLLLVLFGFVTGLILDSEIVFGALFIGGLIFTLVMYRKFFKLKHFALSLFGFFIVLLPRIVFDLRHDYLMSRTFLGFLQGEGTSTTTYGNLQPMSTLHEMFSMWSKTVAVGNETLGLLLLLIVLFGSYSTYRYISDNHKRLFVASGSILLSFFIGLSIFPDAIWEHYIVGLPVVYLFILCSVLYRLYSLTPIYKYATSVVVGLVIIFNIYPWAVSFFGQSWDGDVSTYNTHISVLDTVYSDADGEEFKYIVYTPPVHSYTYDYLFLWYGPKKYGYAPFETADIMYVIVEPDYEDESRRSLWLNNRADDGEIVQEYTINGNIVIQKRLIKNL